MLPKAKDECSFRDILLQELLLTVTSLVPSKPRGSCSHIDMQLILSVLPHKNITLLHYLTFHAPYTEKLLVKIGIYVYTPAHTRTHLTVPGMLLVPLCTQQLCYRETSSKGCKGDCSVCTV